MENEMISLIEKMGLRKISKEKEKNINLQKIKKLEEKYRFTLNSSYVHFICHAHRIEKEWFHHESSLGKIDFQFIKLEKIKKVMKDYLERMPSNFIPIAEIVGGDLLCMKVDNMNESAIYYWDHENELLAKLMIGIEVEVDDYDEYTENLHLISDSFWDFLNEITVEDEETGESDNDDDGADIWIDPKLLK